jgi:hypothetical protein
MSPSTEKFNLPSVSVCQQPMKTPLEVLHRLQIQPCTFQNHCLSQVKYFSSHSWLVCFRVLKQLNHKYFLVRAADFTETQQVHQNHLQKTGSLLTLTYLSCVQLGITKHTWHTPQSYKSAQRNLNVTTSTCGSLGDTTHTINDEVTTVSYK